MSVVRSGQEAEGVPAGGVGREELRRDDATPAGGTIRPEVPDPCRALIAVEVDPHAVDLAEPAASPETLPAPAGRDRGDAAAPGREPDLPIVKERRDDVDLEFGRTRRNVGYAPAGLLDVVDRRVLEEPRDRIEAHPAGRIPISEA